MLADNPFDRAIETRFRHPEECREVTEGVTGRPPEQVMIAACYLTDTLDLLWLAAQAVFGPKAKPEHAISLLGLYNELVMRMPPPRMELKNSALAAKPLSPLRTADEILAAAREGRELL